MSGIWNRTLVYLGLREEPEEVFEELPERFDPEDDPHAEHAPPRPAARGQATSRATAGASGRRSPVAGRDISTAGRDSSVLDDTNETREMAVVGGEAEPAAADRPRAATRGGGGPRDRDERSRGREDRPAGRDDRDRSSDASIEPDGGSNVRSLYAGSDVHVRAVPSSPVARAAVVELEVFDDVEAVGARYRTGQPVLFDVSRTDRATGRRVVDFVSGLTFALRGRLTKVGTGAFLLVPDGVSLSDDERRRLTDLGYRLPTSRDA